MAETLNLRDDMVEKVHYPIEVRESVEQAAEFWQEFCDLPDEIKLAFAGDDPQLTVGYEAKDGIGKNADKKENFDYSLRGAEKLNTLLAQVNNETAAQFIQAIKTLQQQMTPMIEAFGERVENEYGVEGFAEIAHRSAPYAFFRFLHYPAGGEIGDTIAEPHVDHSGFTFHLAESQPGCEQLTFDREWQPLPVASGEAVVFPSMQLQLVSGGEIKGMTHRVQCMNQATVDMGRYAVVCFVALDGVPVYDRKAQGRLQEKPLGFNQDMPDDEFRQLFREQ